MKYKDLLKNYKRNKIRFLIGEETEDYSELVDKTLQHLNKEESTIISLRFIDELPLSEVAEKIHRDIYYVSRLITKIINNIDE
jgi:RNA polymerase sigma factor (sigma-70 family)